MLAFNGDAKLKTDLIAEVIKHRLADQIVAGTYGDIEDNKFKGCAVGCTLHSYGLLQGREIDTADHSVYEEFGIPSILARLQDSIFEGLPQELRVTWPERFYQAISEGADLTKVWPKFAIWLLIDAEHGVIKYESSQDIRSSIHRVAELYANNGTHEEFSKATSAAHAHALSSSAAYANYAANYAAYAAGCSAYNYAYAGDAASAASAAASAYAYYDGARYIATIVQSEKLLELLEEAK